MKQISRHQTAVVNLLGAANGGWLLVLPED